MITKKVRCIYGGYYEQVKSVKYDRALKYKPYAQAGVIVDDTFKNCHILVSYESDIIRVIDGTIDFYGVSPDYSRSTIGHVIAFLKEYAPTISYQQIKRAYHAGSENVWLIDGNKLVNTETGEVI